MVEKSAQILGHRYELGEPIARGGMAVVWRARDTRLDRPVAVKVLHPRLAGDESFRERFRREALAAASFNHPNIITVFDTGEDGDAHYIVMELIEGPSLSRLLGPKGTLTPTETVSMMRAVLSALSYAHDRGVVHRDIKPANIMLSARVAPGAIKVGDFGIARAAAGSDLTATGAIIGTASYLAPEQASGQPIDHRADLYSLACVAYRCLTGRLPWSADNELGVAMARTMRPPDPLAPACPDAPRRLVDVIEAGLARDPAARYQHASDMADALASLRGAAIRLDRTNVVSAKTAANRKRGRNASSGSGAAESEKLAGAGVGVVESTDDGRARLDTSSRTSIPEPALARRQSNGPRRSRGSRRATRDRRSRAHGAPGKRPPPAESQSSRNERARSRARAAAHTRRMQRARRLALGVALSTIVIAVILIGFISAGTDDSTPPETTPPPPISVREAFPFDPEGDRAENTLSVENTLDGDLGDGWETEAYKTRAFGNLKDGVGVGFDLGSIKQPQTLTATISTGTSFELYRADEDFRDLDDWTRVPGSEHSEVGRTDRSDSEDDFTTTEIDTGAIEARYWLLWITELSDQQHNDLYYTEIAEVAFGGP